MNVISSLEYFKIFYYVASRGSITKAATDLAISQPAVSQAVKQLESQLGAKLFCRQAKGVTLTREGSVLFEYVERGYAQMEKGVDSLQQLLNLEAGEVRIGASDMTLKYYLLPFLEQFHERYPKIKVKVTNAPTPETMRFLEEGKIDFGIISTPFEQGENVTALPVRQAEDIFVAGRKFISYKNRMLDLQELEQMPLIFLEARTSTRSFMDAFLKENGVEVRPEFELATSDMIVQFALRSLGVGCVVRDFAQQYIDEGRLFELRFNKIIPKRDFCIIKDRKKTLSTAANKLLELM